MIKDKATVLMIPISIKMATAQAILTTIHNIVIKTVDEFDSTTLIQTFQ